jgi:hypothetical protein
MFFICLGLLLPSLKKKTEGGELLDKQIKINKNYTRFLLIPLALIKILNQLPIPSLKKRR